MGFTAVHLWKYPEKSCKFDVLMTAASKFLLFLLTTCYQTVGLALPYLLGEDLCDMVLVL